MKYRPPGAQVEPMTHGDGTVPLMGLGTGARWTDIVKRNERALRHTVTNQMESFAGDPFSGETSPSIFVDNTAVDNSGEKQMCANAASNGNC